MTAGELLALRTRKEDQKCLNEGMKGSGSDGSYRLMYIYIHNNILYYTYILHTIYYTLYTHIHIFIYYTVYMYIYIFMIIYTQ